MIDLSTDVDAEVSGVDEPLDLRASDRCDRCGAQAFVITMHGETPMLWCAHHYRKNEEKLGPLKVLDHTDRINKAASTSAY